MVSIQVAETRRSTKTMLCAVARKKKTSVQKTTAWEMYNIYIKKSKAFFTHYAYNRDNLYFQDMVPYIKKIK